MIMEGTKPVVMNMEGTPPLRGQPYPTLNHTGLEGTRPLTGPALPNLINAVKMLKSKSTPRWF